MRKLVDILVNTKNWVREVGEIQKRKIRETDLKIDTKSSGIDLVTEVDKLSEKILVEKIEENYPVHSILGEENGTVDKKSNYTWIIDPVDGTNNYSNGYPLYSISIALRFKDDIVLGVIYIPELEEMYTALKGEGAFLNGKEIRVAAEEDPVNCLLATGFPYDKITSRINNLAHFSYMQMQARGIRRSGSAAFDLASVAAGRINGFWEFKLEEWDVAAGRILIKEVGGRVIETTRHDSYLIVAGNSVLCEKILKLLDRVDPDRY
ncbi:MAG: inositol monophosphatase family protein [Halanaerobiales bacterium]